MRIESSREVFLCTSHPRSYQSFASTPLYYITSHLDRYKSCLPGLPASGTLFLYLELHAFTSLIFIGF